MSRFWRDVMGTSETSNPSGTPFDASPNDEDQGAPTQFLEEGQKDGDKNPSSSVESARCASRFTAINDPRP